MCSDVVLVTTTDRGGGASVRSRGGHHKTRILAIAPLPRGTLRAKASPDDPLVFVVIDSDKRPKVCRDALALSELMLSPFEQAFEQV